MKTRLQKLRNIGISAHIDSGKTTLTERILFYTKRIHAIHDVKGKDGIGATMDSMELEKERGITIASAATFCQWKSHNINIIDTPGHVDFTIEVERSLSVLDGAILVLCAVGGVQSQSITVDRQMKRYQVPCLAFINKCDRSGADPERVAAQLRDKLGHNAVMLQLPIGLEADFTGVVDLVRMQAVYFEGESGEDIRIDDIPPELREQAMTMREALLDAASAFSEELTDAILEDEMVSEEVLVKAIRDGALARQLTPVLVGSAYKNRGVQPLLDAVIDYMPSPEDIDKTALDAADEMRPVPLSHDPEKPVVALAFKLEDGRFGQLTYIRVYQGDLKKGDNVKNVRTGKKIRIGRLVRMHADQMEEVADIPPGGIGALFGVECASGDTFVDPDLNLSMTSILVPEPVISLAVSPKDNKSETAMAKALGRFSREDPTFKTFVDQETNETIIQGMGELHLEVYLERMRREYGAEVSAGSPQVAYRETIVRQVPFNYTHKKQTGGAGQFGRVAGFLEPAPGEGFVFENKVTGGAIPTQYISSCEKGFQKCLEKGPWLEFPVVDVRVVINDGASHSVDSSEMAFESAARGAFLEAYRKAGPVLQEPIMKVSVESPDEFQGSVMKLLNQRRGIIIGSQDEGAVSVIEAHVPLSEMFGFSNVLRSSTQGQANFTMEFLSYQQVPASVSEEIERQRNKQQEKT
ncbi:MAG: elongation factor G [Desulfosudaceae bacterium]